MNGNTQLAIVSSRIAWLEIAKGLGVALVVFGHLWYKCLFPAVNQVIYTFHMPMFFILSGFVFKRGNSGFGRFLASKCKRILLPAAIYLLLGAVFSLIMSYGSFRQILRKFLYIDGLCPFNEPCWYFIVLFQLYILSYFLKLDQLSPLFKVIVLAFFFIAGLLVYELEIYMPFGMDRTVIAMVFFTFGSLLGQRYRAGKAIRKPLLYILLIGICMAIWLVFGVFLNGKVSFYLLELGNYFPFISAGICGSVVFIALCKLLSHCKCKAFFIKTAENSIVIVGSHYFAKFVFERIMGHLGLFKTPLYCFIVAGFTVFILAAYNFIGPFLKKHLPAVTGDLR